MTQRVLKYREIPLDETPGSVTIEAVLATAA